MPIKAMAMVNVHPTGAKKGDTYRINMYVGLSQGSNDPMYSNDTWFMGKPFSFEYQIKDTAANTAKALVKNINKFGLNIQGEKELDFKDNGDGTITISAVTEYQRFRMLNIELLHPEKNNNMGEWEVVKGLEDLTEIQKTVPTEVKTALAADTYFNGQEGFGTYDYILHNLRIPTYHNSRFLSVHEDEAPIKGSKYIQYTIHQCANRGPLGLNAVGQNVQSTTTHVLFVLESLANQFETILSTFAGNINSTKKEIQEIVYNPWANSESDDEIGG